MKPAPLDTARLHLDQVAAADVELITEYCRDPIFEQFMLTPWPYRREHAETFVGTVVPRGWASDTEYTWAIRRAPGDSLLGVIGYREATRDLGYWLGAPHRGDGIMVEAATAVLDWLFAHGKQTVAWECVDGNIASATVARRIGFTFTGIGPSALGGRLGSTTPSWHATLSAGDSREPKAGWPTP